MKSGSYLFGVMPLRGNSVGQLATSAAYALVAPEAVPKDLTAPPKPGAFTLGSKMGQVQVTVTAALDYTQGHGHSYTEVLMSVPPAVGTAKGSFSGVAGEVPATAGLGITYRVWIRFVTKDGVTGPLSDPQDIAVGQIVSNEILNGVKCR
jgi:hypothetical protein